MGTLSALLAAIPQPDVAGMARAQQHIDGLCKAARQSWPSGDAGGTAGRSAWLAGSWRWRRKRLWSCAPTMASGMKA